MNNKLQCTLCNWIYIIAGTVPSHQHPQLVPGVPSIVSVTVVMLLSLHVADRITTLALELHPHSPHVGVEPGGHTPAGKAADSGPTDTYMATHKGSHKR